MVWRSRMAAVPLALMTVGGATLLPVHGAAADKTPTALARASSTPRDAIASTSPTVHIVVKNLGQVPLTTIRVKRPATWVSITSGSSSGWTVTSTSADAITFGGVLVPGKAADLAVTSTMAPSPVDRTSSWGVEMSADNGASWSNVPGENNSPVSLQLTEHVLTVGRAVISPPAANNGTLTSGQIVSVSVPVTNVGTGTVTPSASETTIGSDEPSANDPAVSLVHLTRASSVPTLGPGQTGTVTFDGVEVDPYSSGVVHLRTRVSNSALPVLQAAVRTLTVQTPADFTTTSTGTLSKGLSCSPTPANPGHALQCSIPVSKVGDVAGTLDTSTTLTFLDTNTRYVAPLVSATPFSAGSASLTLQFASVTVPEGMTTGMTYTALVSFRGVDANGATIDAGDENDTPDGELVDDAPTVVRSGYGQTSTGRPNIGITFSEKVKGTSDARNWTVTDSAGNRQTVTTVTGSSGGSYYWSLELSTSPSDMAPGPLTVTYTPGDLADAEGSPLYAVTFTSSPSS